MSSPSASLTVPQRRAQFAAGVDDGDLNGLAKQISAPPRRQPAAGWTTRAVWHEDNENVVAFVGAQEENYADLALAHGLFHARGRKLTLVLPSGWERPTLQRAAWFNTAVEVWTHLGGALDQVAVPERDQTATCQEAGGVTTSRDKHLGRDGDLVRRLVEWASMHSELEAAHHSNLRAWSCRGQRVLVVRSTRKGIVVTAGIDANAAPAKSSPLAHGLTDAELDEWTGLVERAVTDAKAQKHGKFEEHHLQGILRRNPHALGLEAPVLREVPAWRPSGGPKPRGRGFLDLVALDGLGDINLVETKLAADDMLVLQGLDYWYWASAKPNRAWLVERLHADPDRAALRLVYAVGGKGGATPTLSRYAKAHLNLLHDDVCWRLALIKNWPGGDPSVDLLPLQAMPDTRASAQRAQSAAGMIKKNVK